MKAACFTENSAVCTKVFEVAARLNMSDDLNKRLVLRANALIHQHNVFGLKQNMRRVIVDCHKNSLREVDSNYAKTATI
jgi:hypothetical protein